MPHTAQIEDELVSKTHYLSNTALAPEAITHPCPGFEHSFARLGFNWTGPSMESGPGCTNTSGTHVLMTDCWLPMAQVAHTALILSYVAQCLQAHWLMLWTWRLLNSSHMQQTTPQDKRFQTPKLKEHCRRADSSAGWHHTSEPSALMGEEPAMAPGHPARMPLVIDASYVAKAFTSAQPNAGVNKHAWR